MMEFISRSCCDGKWEVIIKGDAHDLYPEAEAFVRRLIGHAKPMTTGDEIRAKNNKELAEFLSDFIVDHDAQRLLKEGCELTATQISAIKHTWFCSLCKWLEQPAEVEA